MGLDMYLNVKRRNDDDEIVSELVYWRKANQIRQWFVDNIDYPVEGNCPKEVTKEQLQKLVEDCKVVLEAKDNELANKILPTKSGFFFGSLEYDEWYYDALDYTIKKVQDVIDDYDDYVNDEYCIVYDEWY